MTSSFSPLTHLDGQVAVITGGTGAIGAATARRLAALGARVVLLHRGSADKAQPVLQTLTGSGHGAVTASVTDSAQLNAAAQAVAGGTARQGGAAPQLRRPVPPPLSPQFGARGFRAERPSGNGRSPGGRVDQPAVGAAPAPRKDNDPLAPIMALSEEERIALFS